MRRPAFLLLSLLVPACAGTIAGEASDAAVPVDATGPLTDAPAPSGDTPVPPPDAPAVPPAPFTVTDDCLPGTWCWERPLPTAETVSAATLTANGGVAFVTEDGTLAEWRDGRWRTRVLSLPGRPSSLYAQGPGRYWLTSSDRDRAQRSYITRVEGAAVTTTPMPAGRYVSTLVGDGANELWALGSRAPFRWDGAQWVEGTALPGNPLLATMIRTGPGELLILESWGSGSGYGRLHRYRDGAYTLVYDFRDLELRIDGPIVARGNALWLRGWDSARSRGSLVHFDGATWQAYNLPPGADSANLVGVGDAVWAVYGSRAWRREGNGWVSVEGFTGRQYGTILGAPDGTVWDFSNGVARRQGDTWTSFGEGSVPTLGFLHDAPAAPALVTVGAPGVLVPGAADGRGWVTASFGWMGEATALSSTPAATWVATEGGLHRLFERGVAAVVPLPNGLTRPRFLAGNTRSVWTLDDALRPHNFTGGSWTQVPSLPAPREAPNADARPLGLHVAESGAVYGAGSWLRGDKQVFNRLYQLRGAAWIELVATTGEFGREERAAFTSGVGGSVYFSNHGVYAVQDGNARIFDAMARPVDLALDGARNLLGLEEDAVIVWSPNGQRAQTLPLPTALRGRFQHVHRDALGRVRVSNAAGHVLRYTPAG